MGNILQTKFSSVLGILIRFSQKFFSLEGPIDNKSALALGVVRQQAIPKPMLKEFHMASLGYELI